MHLVPLLGLNFTPSKRNSRRFSYLWSSRQTPPEFTSCCDSPWFSAPGVSPVATQQQGEQHQTVPAVFCSFSSEGTRRILQAREQECVKCTLTSQPGLEVSGKKTIKRTVQGACKRELAPGVCAQAKNRVSRAKICSRYYKMDRIRIF